MMPKDTNPHGSIKGAYHRVDGNTPGPLGVYPVTAYFYGRFSSGKQGKGTHLAKLAAETLADISADLDQEIRDGKREPGVYDVRDELARRLNFPVDPDPLCDIKALCK